ncbi:MAG TPA: 16S rRNA (cytosine(967)-C(5))-methyltransferase RsmB [Burkholderiales bacterium]|nr:16S rRNA (cytosine(967)-C(5))-methyltransferase RsmB [Burkholderiales bacterium]
MLEIQRLAAHSVNRVLAGRNLDRTLQEVWRMHPALAADERAAIQSVAYGTLRQLGLLRGVLHQLLQHPLVDERLRCLLLIALYQLQFSQAAPYAVVDHAVETVRALGHGRAGGLVNAVLRNFLRRRDALIAAAQSTETGRYSYPQWWIDRLRAEHPDGWRAVLEAGNQHPPMTLRINRRAVARDDYLARLTRDGMTARAAGAAGVILETPLPVERVPGFADGLVSVQDAGAQLAAPLLDVHDGMRVLDACAAPGGKTAHILECAEVDLLALDSDAQRLTRVADNLSRLGLSAPTLCADAGALPKWWDGTPFDRILLDAPCSASGVVRRHPDIKWLRRARDVAQFAEHQARMLSALWQALGRDGKLLYATCSVFAEENQAVISAFLSRQPDAQPLAAAGLLLPDANHDGFYYALLHKS